MKTNLAQHPCKNKCTDFKEEQCSTCLVRELPSIQNYDSDFLPGDVVVLTVKGTTSVLLEIIEHKYTSDLYRVKILSTGGTSGPIHKDKIRTATLAELNAKRRLTETEQALAEVS